MSKNNLHKEAYIGQRSAKYAPDLRNPQRATLNHIETHSRKLAKKPTFERAVKIIVDEYGPIPALVMLMPIAFGAVGDLQSMGTEVGQNAPLETFSHAIYANLNIGNIEGSDITNSDNHLDRLYIDNGRVKNDQRSFVILEPNESSQETYGDHYFATDMGWDRGPTHILPITNPEQVLLAQSDLTLAAVERGLVVNTSDIVVLGMHRNAAYLQSKEGRYYGNEWNEYGVIAVGFDQASGKPFIASAKGTDGNVVFEPEKYHSWQINVMDVNPPEQRDDGSSVVKWNVVGTPVSETVFQVVTNTSGNVSLELVLPNEDKEMVSLPITDNKLTGDNAVKGLLSLVSIEDQDGESIGVTESVTANFDLGVILESGEVNEDGSRNIDTFVPTEKFADNKGAVEKWLSYFDAERLGFDPGSTKWILTADGRAVLVDSTDHSKVIAEWKDVPWIGKPVIVWNYENMVESDGDNALLDVCENWPTRSRNGAPEDYSEIFNFSKTLHARESQMIINGAEMMYGSEGGEENILSTDGAIYSSDGMKMVYYRQMKNPYDNTQGFVLTRRSDGKSIILYVENMIWQTY